MQQIAILVVGKHPEIMKTILRLINNKPEWKGSGAFSVEEATALRNTISFDIVLLGAGLSDDETDQIKAIFDVPVVAHYGGGSGLLYAEVYQALGM
jgi:hypothetical protein